MEIKKNARVVGDLKAQRPVIEDEAYFKGNVETTRAEALKAAPATAPQPAAGAAAAAAGGRSAGCCRRCGDGGGGASPGPDGATGEPERMKPEPLARSASGPAGGSPAAGRRSYALEQVNEYLEKFAGGQVVDLGAHARAQSTTLRVWATGCMRKIFCARSERQAKETRCPGTAWTFRRHRWT